jgi:hypothetical protein
MRFSSRLMAAVALGLPAICAAEPNDYVQVPNVEYGEREIDFKYGTWRFDDTKERESAASLGLGWGVTQWWFTEAYLKYHKEAGDRARYDAFEWENKFQLTETNKYPVDVGFLVEVEVPRARDEGYNLEMGPLFQFDTGALRWNANMIFQRSFSSRAEGDHPTLLNYQLQAAYHLVHNFDVGMQAFGEMGPWDHWASSNEQVHRIGPAVFGKVKLGEGRQAIRYNAAWLFGASKAAPDNGFRLQAEYEF